MKRYILSFASAWLALLLVFVPDASAADGVWTNNVYDAEWGWTNNWVDGQVASGAGSTATLTNTMGLRVRQKTVGLTLGRMLQKGGSFEVLENSFIFDNNGASPEIYVGNTLLMRSNIETVGPLPIVKTGTGTLSMKPDNGTNTFSAGFMVNEGNLEINSSATATGMPLGVGPITLNGQVYLNISRAGGHYAAVTNTGAVVTFSGVPIINPGTATVTLGAPNAPANSVLVRSNFGILTLNSSALGTTAKILVNGGVAVSGGVTCLPITASPFLLTYDAVVGFTNAVETIGVMGGAGTIACVTNATTLGTDASVRALRTSVIVNNAFNLTISNGVTLTVGDGVNPAFVQLGAAANSTYGNIIGNGTLNFGASEGIITFGGTGNNNSVWPGVSCVISGSGGLTLMCGASSGQGRLLIGRNNTYTGPTRIINGSVSPSGDTITNAFGAAPIYLLGTSVVGGQLMFGYFTKTITNTLYVSGVGSAMRNRGSHTKPTGAIAFDSTSGSNACSGPVILQGDTRFSAPGNTNNYGLISGPISGNYGVELGYTGTAEQFGTVRFSGTNTYSGTTTVSSGTLELLSAESLAPGPVSVVSNLVFNFAGNAVFNNIITGNGRITQKGGGKIRLINAKGFTGELISQSGELLLGAESGTLITIQ